MTDETAKPAGNSPNAPFYVVLSKIAQKYYGDRMLFPRLAAPNKTKTKLKER